MKINNKDTCLLKKLAYIYISIRTNTKKQDYENCYNHKNIKQIKF